MKVSLDVSAIPAQAGGVGRYVLGLTSALDSIAKSEDLEVALISRGGDVDRWAEAAPNSSIEDAAPSARPLRLAWEQARLPSLISRLGAEVHHGPHYTMPEKASVGKVVTIHDMTFFDHPEWHQRSKVPFFKRAIRVASKSADVLVCVSASTAERLVSICTPQAEVVVVPHGVDLERFSPHEPEGWSDMDALARVGVREPYVLFVGTIEPRKDVPSLVSAFDRVCSAHGDLTLVLAGSPGWGEESLSFAIESIRNPDRVIRLGFVEDLMVPALLRRAAAVAYPSLEEGFGLPVLEALACAAPVVTTSGSAMEEVASGAALLVKPGDTDGLAGALDMLVRGDESLEQRQRRGLAIASKHTWKASAAGHLGAYRKAAGSAG